MRVLDPKKILLPNHLDVEPSAGQAVAIFGKAEAFWLVGYTLPLLEPSMILFTVNNLTGVGSYALVLWFSYLFVTGLQYRRQTRRK